jgi:transcriptional regulator with XRE-family HTH domain
MESQKSACANNLAFFRKRKGMRQKDLAQVLNVGNATVSGWEGDAFSPRLKTLYQLCEILDVSLPELLGVDSSTAQMFSQDEIALVNAYRNHPDLQKAVRIVLGIEE